MKKRASDVVAIALAEVGYKEKASNSQLDDKTANAGSANYTKYARDLKNAGYYNGNKNGFAWCDVFVDWCFYKAFGSEGQKVQCQTGDLGAGCQYSKAYFQKQGRCDKTPKVGDQVFFTSGGEISHTGIVYDVSGTTIKTVEGNSSDQVAKRSYSLSNSYVDSFGHPWYDEEDDTEDSKQDTDTSGLAVGDVVNFTGTTHYTSANATKAKTCKPGYATITRIYKLGSSKHPYHCVRTADSEGTVYGWVDAADISAIEKTATTETKTTATADEEAIWNFLFEKIGHAYGAAGMMGNLYAESALKPKNLQNSYEKSLGYSDDDYTAAVDNGTYNNFVTDAAGYGLAQWTYHTRKAGLLAAAQSAGKSIGDLQLQLEFLWKELSTDYKSVLKKLQSASSVREASDAVLKEFERPADTGETVQEKRASYGEAYFNKYAGGTAETVPATEATERTYTVVKGDCLWNIAKSYLGNGARYKEIKELNGLMYDTIYVGQLLKIPEK